MTESTVALLEGVRVIESSLLEPGALGMHLAELGAEVIKVEAPGEGDYIRRLAWPFIEGVSILHWHVNRGKRSIALDLRQPEGVDVYKDLVRSADVVIEGMRPGALARRGLSYESMCEVNPAIVFCTLSGFGLTGPYRDLPSHGIAFDSFSGHAPPEIDERGFTTIGPHSTIGTKAGPLYGALGVLAAVIRARSSGQGTWLEVAQTDAAAAVNWLKIEGEQAYRRPEPEVTGNPSDGGIRRPPGATGMREGVRYQYYESANGHILFMASERAFWKNFCEGVGRADLFDQHPGSEYADHALGNLELRRELKAIFVSRTTAEWVDFGVEVNTPIVPVNSPESIVDDPQFQERMAFYPASELGTELMPSPIKVVDGELPMPTRAPTLGQHADEILRDVLGYDAARVDALRNAGTLG
ncbi:MAG: CoA transferase [Deltaproteobacteria bacterium]|jgi:crotonobetainyl-CoA:carnitine CoA-transferase CaiB-like acyl-CoA transferase|nr:CoA transferase [Deltaproteobacteria bacterium]MBW2497630.1 CoA transferase [Deltaproteobacteria bacterium]